MYMFRHHNERNKINHREMLRYLQPSSFYNSTSIIQEHLPIMDFPKQVPALECTDRDEIRSGLGVVITIQPERLPSVSKRMTRHASPPS